MFLNRRVTFRVTEKELEKAEKIIKKNSHNFENISHFARCSFIKLIREVGEGELL